MPAANPNLFDPPTPAKLAEHLAANPTKPGSGLRSRLPLLVITVLAVSLLFAGNVVLALLPWMVLVGFMLVLAGQINKAKALSQQVTRAWELALLRQYREALRRSWRLLPEVRDQPELHGRCVAILAHALDELAAYEAATVAFDYLLERLPAEHPLAIRVRVQRAAAAVCLDHLADADDALRKLRPIAEEQPHTQIAAAYHLARLIQDVRTGHFAEAAQHAGQTAQRLQPLGVEAGYGHGLLAYCCDQLATHEPDHDAARQWRDAAANWWRTATLLIPPAALIHRFNELRPLAQERLP